MRALALTALLLAPLAMASAGAVEPEPAGDLIVTLQDGAASPGPGRVALSAFPGFVLFDASARDAARLAADPRVERVDWAKPLAFAEARLASRAFTSLTRADATGLDGSGVTVAVVDSGIDTTHPDLLGRVARNVKLLEGAFVPATGDPDGHGTHVAGIVASSGASSQGRWQGVAPGAQLVGVDISSRFTTASAVLAYDWLLANHDALGIGVVVNAWGRVDREPFDARDPVMRAIDRLVAEGVVVIFSASNHGPDAATLSAEAMHPRVVSVGATDATGVVMSYSSRGPVLADAPWTKPDVVAPGDAVVAPRSLQSLPRDADPDALHTVYSGTSQAAPHVAGIVAMMLQSRPSLTPAEVGEALRASAIDLGEVGPDDATGFGLVDAYDAIRAARGLAPDRGNVLVTGGTDTYEDGAALAATQQRGFLEILQRPDVLWETAFPVKPGATSLRVEADVGAATSYDVELLHEGRLHRTSQVEQPGAGIWALRLVGTLPVATDASVTIRSDLPAHPARALQYEGKAAGSRVPPPALDEPAAWDVATVAGQAAAVALAATVLAVALWPGRDEK